MKTKNRRGLTRELVEMKAKGLLYSELAKVLGVSRQRVQQLFMPPKEAMIVGKRIVCNKTGKVHYEQEDIVTFEFTDYSWWCSACGGRHCSNCFYETDGETITVTDCGRFD